MLAWSRYRFVRFAADEQQATTLAMLAECLEELGGVPKVVLADRMACLKGNVVANVVVPAPDYVRFASHYRFRSDFCHASDPETKGIGENLVGYAKDDLSWSHSSSMTTPGPPATPESTSGRGHGASRSTAVATARSTRSLGHPCRPRRW